MSKFRFPTYYGCPICFAHLRAAGEVRAAHKARTDLEDLKERMGGDPERYELPRGANETRIENAKRQAARTEKPFESHDCEHKEEQERWVQKLKG